MTVTVTITVTDEFDTFEELDGFLLSDSDRFHIY